MLETKRLVLRPLVAGDAGWITDHIRHPEVQRWLTSPPHPYRLQHAEEFLTEHAGVEGVCAILRQGNPLGLVTLTVRDSVPDLGYWLRIDAWGQGVMTEAANTLLAWHDRTVGTPVESGWIEGNEASENVLTKLGFERTGARVKILSHFHGREVPVIRVRRHPKAVQP